MSLYRVSILEHLRLARAADLRCEPEDAPLGGPPRQSLPVRWQRRRGLSGKLRLFVDY